MKKFNADKELRKLIKKNNPKIKLLFTLLGLEIIALAGLIYTFYQKNEEKILTAGIVETFTPKESKLTIYLNDQEGLDYPSREAGYVFNKIICQNGSKAVWNEVEWQVDFALDEPDYCQIYFSN